MNVKSLIRLNTASNLSLTDRQKDDFYATDPKALRLLLEKESFAPHIWECACGQGHLSKVLIDAGYAVKSTDLIYRNFGVGGGWISSLAQKNLMAIS